MTTEEHDDYDTSRKSRIATEHEQQIQKHFEHVQNKRFAENPELNDFMQMMRKQIARDSYPDTMSVRSNVHDENVIPAPTYKPSPMIESLIPRRKSNDKDPYLGIKEEYLLDRYNMDKDILK